MHTDHRLCGQHRLRLLVRSAVLALLTAGVAGSLLVVGDWGWGPVKLNTIPATALHQGGIDLRPPAASLRACELVARTGSEVADMACPGFSASLRKAQRLSAGDGERALADCSIAEVGIDHVPCWLVITDTYSGPRGFQLCYADPRVMRLPPNFADTTPQAQIRHGNLIFVDVHTAEVLGVVILMWRSDPPPTTIRGCG